MRLARVWNLSLPLRLAIACSAAGYLLYSRPWTEPDQSKAIGVYNCSIAFLVLALVPKRTRLWVAVCVALAVPFLADISIDALRLVR